MVYHNGVDFHHQVLFSAFLKFNLHIFGVTHELITFKETQGLRVPPKQFSSVYINPALSIASPIHALYILKLGQSDSQQSELF